MKLIKLFGAGVQSKSAVATSQRRLNCYVEITADGDKNTVIIYGTPGYILFKNLGSTPVRGWRVLGNNLYVVLVDHLLKIDFAGNTTTVGTLDATDSITSTVELSDNGTQLIIVTGVYGYTYNINTTTFAKISDADFQNGCTTVTELVGFFIVEKPNSGQFYVSDSYDGTSWQALQFATAEAYPDYLVAVEAYHGTIILWGQTSIEYEQPSGASDFPFSPIQGSAQQWGLAAKYSRQNINNSIIFLAQNIKGQVQVMMINSYVPDRISTSDIENAINSLSIVSDAVSLSYMVDGHPMYQITFPTGMRSFLYDCSTSVWSEVQSGVGLTGRHNANLSITFNGNTYLSDYQNGNIYRLSPTTYTENGNPIKRQLRSRHLINDFNIIGLDEVFIDMETGVGLDNGQGSDPQVILQISKDGGRTYGYERFASLGRGGNYLQRLTYRRCGGARDLVAQLTMTDPVKFVVTNAAATVRRGRG